MILQAVVPQLAGLFWRSAKSGSVFHLTASIRAEDTSPETFNCWRYL